MFNNAGAAGGTIPGGAAVGGQGAIGGTTAGTMIPSPPVVDGAAPPFVQDDTGTSGLPQATIDMLKAGGSACTVSPSYPYEGTVFPGGLQSPIVMWTGGAEAAYMRFAYEGSDIVNYEFATGSNPAGEMQIPRDAWNEITRRTNRVNLNVTFTVQSGGALSTCTLHWKVAAGNMIGALYYNTYQAPPPGIPDTGAVMRLTLGADAEIYKQFTGPPNLIPSTGPCFSCHSVSFNGSTLVASFHDYFVKTFKVEKYDVTATAQPAAANTLHNVNFGALTPDGSRILAMGNPDCTDGSDTFPRKPNNFPLVEGNDVARMVDTNSGENMNAPGLDPNNYMWMAQFSPDGDKVVFNHAKPDGMGGTDRMELAVMDYDYDSNTFSNLQVIATAPSFSGVSPTAPYMPITSLAGPIAAYDPDETGPAPACVDPMKTDANRNLGYLPVGSCTGPCYPGWPFFTPDGKGVIFSLVSEPDFAQAFPGRDAPSKSDLWYVDVGTLEVVRLDNANRGNRPIDELNNYYPTVLPIAIGGYFWMFWTGVRDYGHKVEGRVEGALPDAIRDADKKRIWVSAIKPKFDAMDSEIVVPGPLTDPSLPGFYLDGQSESGNVRAFAALNPCLDNGAECSSGLDCCCGYCAVEAGAATGMCSCDPPVCSKTNEKCETSADCCPPEGDDPQNVCIGGFCTFILVE